MNRILLCSVLVLLLGGLTSAQAQDLDIQASLDPHADDGVFEHGLLVLEIHNAGPETISDIQVRFEGANFDLSGNRVMQLDDLSASGTAVVFESYSALSGSDQTILPMRVSYTDSSGQKELSLVSQPRKLDNWEN